MLKWKCKKRISLLIFPFTYQHFPFIYLGIISSCWCWTLNKNRLNCSIQQFSWENFYHIRLRQFFVKIIALRKSHLFIIRCKFKKKFHIFFELRFLKFLYLLLNFFFLLSFEELSDILINLYLNKYFYSFKILLNFSFILLLDNI